MQILKEKNFWGIFYLNVIANTLLCWSDVCIKYAINPSTGHWLDSPLSFSWHRENIMQWLVSSESVWFIAQF